MMEMSNPTSDLYTVSKKELYTFKMIHKTNVAYSELHTHTAWQKALTALFQMSRVIVMRLC
jgi:hypothetical protein